MGKRQHTTVEAVRHHMDPVQDDIVNAGNHEALTKKRNTALDAAETWQPLDGKKNKIADYQHGDPLDSYASKDLNAND